MADLIQYSNGVPAIRFKLDKAVTYIGRNAEINDICVLDSFMSKQHALIERQDSSDPDQPPVYVLRDLGSTNRTYVNHQPIMVHELVHKDMIRFGEQEFRFIDEVEEKPLPVEGPNEFHDTHPDREEDTRELPRELSGSDPSSASGRFSRRLNILR
jgi:pSer/pThr/pTyr-binding forkhead associated (FHA) protein